MSERKYTDEQIVKALECCQSHTITDCRDCPNRASGDNCVNELMRNALDLIKRQKAEIESLEYSVRLQAEMLYEARAEAIKEFVEKLKQWQYESSDWSHVEHPYVVEVNEIDNLVAEMTEGE